MFLKKHKLYDIISIDIIGGINMTKIALVRHGETDLTFTDKIEKYGNNIFKTL